MGRPERPLDETGGPVSDLARDLRELRRSVGNPSYRELAQRALFVPSVLSSAASGHRLPTLAVTLAFVSGCGGDTAAWERRWHAVAGDPRVAAPDPRTDTRARPGSTRGAHGLAPGERTDYTVPAQLPPEPGAFIGRGPALARACEILGRPGFKAPLLIRGQVGTGKTAFALRLADRFRAEFPDGQLYADLGSCGPENQSTNSVMRGFLRALGIQDPLIPEDPMHRIGLYRSLLARRRLFVLLENPGDEGQLRPLLAHTTHSQVVVTGRGRLLGIDAGHRVGLGPFERAESLALLRRCAEGRPEQPGAATEIAELCDDLPLALAVVGRRLRARPEWTLGHLARLLADRDRLLATLRAGDVGVRERLDSAYRTLAPDCRTALRRLGSAAARWTTAAELGDALGVREHAADDLLESLVDAGLVQQADAAGRHHVSPLVAAYAAGLRRDAAGGGTDPTAPLPQAAALRAGAAPSGPAARAAPLIVLPARS